MSTTEKPPKRPLNPLSIWVPIILICLGLVVFWNYLYKLKLEQIQPRLPILSRLEKNFIFTERSGKQVEMKDLKGKIIVACWVFTKCPRGCPGVVAEMLKLHEQYKDNPNVHFLSVSVDPDDTPEQLRKFVEPMKITGDNWWFVNGAKDDVRVYMTRYFRFMDVQDVPEQDRLTPDDKFIHDMKLAVVDQQGHVRGHYDVFSSDPQFSNHFKSKIREDIETLLKENK